MLLKLLCPRADQVDQLCLTCRFVNDEKLAPNVPRALMAKDVVSFGGPRIVHSQTSNQNPFAFRLEDTRLILPSPPRRQVQPSVHPQPTPSSRVVLDLTEVRKASSHYLRDELPS